jgi:hypothetical protein
MSLDEAQKATVKEWVAQGMKLADIQKRLDSEFGLRLTYMEVRFLVDDLKVVPKDVDPPKPAAPQPASPAPVASAAPLEPESDADLPPPGGRVSVTVDQLARPGAIVSGKVTFTDGQTADWYLDQTGRLGLSPKQPGYRPPATDVQQFQMALEAELSKIGF